MHRTSTRLAVAFVAVLALAGCDDSDPVVEGDPTGTGAETTTAPDATGTGTTDADVTLATASSSFGTILVDGEGLTLYVFDNDSGGESSCYDDDGCATTWPPVTGTAAAGDGVDASLIGTTARTDGTMQVTYNGMPLYLYAADSQPGDVNGQAIGEVWWVIGPDGEKITAANALPDDETYGLGAS